MRYTRALAALCVLLVNAAIIANLGYASELWTTVFTVNGVGAGIAAFVCMMEGA